MFKTVKIFIILYERGAEKFFLQGPGLLPVSLPSATKYKYPDQFMCISNNFIDFKINYRINSFEVCNN